MIEIYKDKKGEFRFRVKARNGRILCASEGYKTKRSCENGIDSLQDNTYDPKIRDLTATEAQA